MDGISGGGIRGGGEGGRGEEGTGEVTFWVNGAWWFSGGMLCGRDGVGVVQMRVYNVVLGGWEEIICRE